MPDGKQGQARGKAQDNIYNRDKVKKLAIFAMVGTLGAVLVNKWYDDRYQPSLYEYAG